MRKRVCRTLPWNGELKLNAYGLRDAVLRESYSMSRLGRVTEHAMPLTSSVTARTVRAWRFGHGCTREQWDELVRVIEAQTRKTVVVYSQDAAV